MLIFFFFFFGSSFLTSMSFPPCACAAVISFGQVRRNVRRDKSCPSTKDLSVTAKQRFFSLSHWIILSSVREGKKKKKKKVPFFKIPGASVGVCVCICLEGARRAPVAVLLSSRVHLLRSENIEIKKTTRPCDFLSVVHSVLFDSFADCFFSSP